MHYQLGEIYKNLKQQQLNEALGLGSYNYPIPDDPKQKVYDFYYLSLIGNTKSLGDTIMQRAWKGGTFHGGQFNEEQVMDLVASINETQSKLLDHLKDDLLDATYFAIASEFRYVLSLNNKDEVYALAKDIGLGAEFANWYKTNEWVKNQPVNKMIKGFMKKDDPLYDFATRANVYKGVKNQKMAFDPVTGKEVDVSVFKSASDFLGSNSARISSYASAKKAFPEDEDFIKLAEACFFNLKWNGSYGGEAWGKIAQGWQKLNESYDNLMMMVYIDHLFDLEHNTGAMLNKVKRWSHNGDWDWIKKALDYKRDSKQPLYDFEDKISPAMSYLGNRIRYALTGMAQDNPALKQLEAELKKKNISTGATLPKSSTGSSGSPTVVTPVGGSKAKPFMGMKKGDKVVAENGQVGVLHKVGTTGKPYVKFSSISSIKYGIDGMIEAKYFPSNNTVNATAVAVNKLKKDYGNFVEPLGTKLHSAEYSIGDMIKTDKGLEGTVAAIGAGNDKTISVKIKKLPSGLNQELSYVKFNSESGEAVAYFLPSLSDYKPTDQPKEYGVLYKPGAKGFGGSTGTPAGYSPPVKKSAIKSASLYTSPPQLKVPKTNAIQANYGALTNMIAKFHPKPVKATGPAGKGGVNTLVVKMWLPQAAAGTGRNAYSGYLKAKGSHSQLDDRLYYNSKEIQNPKSLSIQTKKGTKYIGPTDDKAVVKDLQFVMEPNKKMRITNGVIASAILRQGIILDGAVTLVNCKLDGCEIGTEFAAKGYMVSTNVVSVNMGPVNVSEVSVSWGLDPVKDNLEVLDSINKIKTGTYATTLSINGNTPFNAI